MLTLDERDHLLRRQGEVCRELDTLRADEFCPGDESPLILEDGLNRELDRIEDVLAEDTAGGILGAKDEDAGHIGTASSGQAISHENGGFTVLAFSSRNHE